jgi:hypothetical protein
MRIMARLVGFRSRGERGERSILSEHDPCRAQSSWASSGAGKARHGQAGPPDPRAKPLVRHRCFVTIRCVVLGVEIRSVQA